MQDSEETIPNTKINDTSLRIFFSIAIGFPIPYFGFLTVEGMEGSLLKVMSPLIDLKYNENITETFKLPSPAPKTPIEETGHSRFIGHPMNPGNGNIVHYFDNETLVFLYLDSKTKAVTYDTTNGIHRKIMGSASPNEHMDKILHVRLGKNSLFNIMVITVVEFSREGYKIREVVN